MIRNDRSSRSYLTLATTLTWFGIVLAMYGIDVAGGLAVLCGLVLLGVTVHRLGRAGDDA
jgi:hypothetical protein